MESDEDGEESAKCDSCGKPFIEHDGLIRTCHKLQLAMKALRFYAEYDFPLCQDHKVAKVALEVIRGN